MKANFDYNLNLMRFGIASTFILVLLFAFGCKKEQTNILASDDIVQSNPIPETISFNYHVRPILSDRCFKCHGPDKAKIEAGLSFKSREDAIIALGDKKDHYAILKWKKEGHRILFSYT